MAISLNSLRAIQETLLQQMANTQEAIAEALNARDYDGAKEMQASYDELEIALNEFRNEHSL